LYVIILCCIVAIPIGVGGSAVASSGSFHSSDSHIVTVSLPEPNTLTMIARQGIPIITVDRLKMEAVVLVTPEERTWLSALGLTPQIVPDSIAEEQGWKSNPTVNRDFHSYAEMTTALQTIADTYPDIASLYDLGHSVQDRVLWGLKITDNPTIEEDEPEVRMCGVHHGNEDMGAELCLLLAQYLTDNYGTNTTVTSLVDSREIWIIPMVNPDGHEMGIRENANGVDLNRDYGYMWGGWGDSPHPFSQPETQVMRMNALNNSFVLSLSFHTSAEVVNYIWNYKEQRAPDNALIENLSEQYGSHTGYWVVEGYDWYQTMGDTNDFSYGCRGDFDWTIETSNSNIQQVWDLNREAMFDIIKAADLGLRGLVTDAQTGQPVAATVWVQEAFWPCFADPLVGDFHKPLLPGSYHVTVRANGYQEQEFSVEVEAGHPTYLNVSLSRAYQYYGYQITVADYYAPSDNFQNNPTEAIAALGPPDGSCASLGVNGYIIVDMRDNITDGDGPDFTVYEGDGTTDGYLVYGSPYWNGPWTNLGTGMGTTTFDLANASIESAQYMKIVDDGTGSPGEQNPGCDIDAIENLAATGGNLPPNTPAQPVGPLTGAANVVYTYTTSTTDPESQQVLYQWSWGDAESPWLGPYDSGAVAEATHSWSTAGDYLVRVRAKDTAGAMSGWSTPIMVRIEASPVLEIGAVTGGFKVHATVHNAGAGVATNVPWNISLQGGVVLVGRQTNGLLNVVQPGFSPQIQTGFILGIGRLSITVIAGSAEKTVGAFLFGPFVFVKK
jgi:hypothetical protein